MSNVRPDLKIFALVSFIFASLFSVIAWSFNFMPAAYKVDFDESYGKGHGPQAVSLTSSSDGGYAFAGTWGAGFGAWLVKTDSKGQQQWEQVFNSRRASTQVGRVALTTKDHGYVLAGETNELDLLGATWDPIPDLSGSGGGQRPIAALVSKIDKNGQVIWKKIFGAFNTRYYNTIYQGIAVEDGFLFLGTTKVVVPDQLDQRGKGVIDSLWLFKVNEAGELLWERTFPQDNGEYLSPSLLADDYAKLVINKAGNIVIMTEIADRLSEKINGRLIIKYGEGHLKRLLAIKLDKNGNELTRTRLPFGLYPKLMVDGDGYRLSHNKRVDQHNSIHIVKLDAELKVVSEQVIAAKNFMVQVAVPGPNGGLHLAGVHVTPPNERGQAAVAFLTKEGELLHEKLFGINSFPGDLVAGASSAEAVFLWWGGWSETAHLTKVRLAE